MAIFAVLGVVVVLLAVAADPSEPNGEPVTATLSAAPGGSAQPTITVDPATDLVDHQVVTVEGEGFDPAGSVSIWQCTADDRSMCSTTDFSEIDDDGSFIRTVGVIADGCRSADAACGLSVAAWGEVDQEYHWLDGRVPLSFDPDAPPVVPSPVTATPLTAYARLVEGDTLEVDGEGFVPTEEVYATTCIKRDGPKQCLIPTTVHAAADDDGTVAITYEPEPFDGFAGVEDCRGAECFVLVWGSALGSDDESVRAPFALDP